MYISLSKSPVGYMRVATKKQLVMGKLKIQNDKINQTMSSNPYAMFKQILGIKYNYQDLPKVHGLIMEEYLKKFLGRLGNNNI
ncbi:hypothetical protein ABN702_20540 [Bacillus haimaensis]|uniref:hypothetical protein n=1 Tax=Bacillus haimaensis TaxID=3160967 RepID=UPI003AA8A75B